MTNSLLLFKAEGKNTSHPGTKRKRVSIDPGKYTLSHTFGSGLIDL